jgi:hypothetical protein
MIGMIGRQRSAAAHTLMVGRGGGGGRLDLLSETDEVEAGFRGTPQLVGFVGRV